MDVKLGLLTRNTDKGAEEDNGVTGGCRELHFEELRNLYSSPSVVGKIKSTRVRCVGHVARMG
jgi:hypothetical protein